MPRRRKMGSQGPNPPRLSGFLKSREASYVTRPAPCCGRPLNDATVVELPPGDLGGKPRRLDYSVCFHCGEWLRFTDDQGTLRKVTVEDWLDLTDENRSLLTRMTKMVRDMRRMIPPTEGD